MPPTDDLDTRLRSGFQTQHRYLADDGFTARTMQRLPAPGRRRGRILGATFALSLVTAGLLAGDLAANLTANLTITWAQIAKAVTALSAAPAGGLPPVTALAIPVALIVTLVFLRDETS